MLLGLIHGVFFLLKPDIIVSYLGFVLREEQNLHTLKSTLIIFFGNVPMQNI